MGRASWLIIKGLSIGRAGSNESLIYGGVISAREKPADRIVANGMPLAIDKASIRKPQGGPVIPRGVKVLDVR